MGSGQPTAAQDPAAPTCSPRRARAPERRRRAVGARRRKAPPPPARMPPARSVRGHGQTRARLQALLAAARA
eukprot:6793227-Lingulodinium_polyedra.AAC.1